MTLRMKMRTYTADLESTENPPITKKFVKEAQYLKQNSGRKVNILVDIIMNLSNRKCKK